MSMFLWIHSRISRKIILCLDVITILGSNRMDKLDLTLDHINRMQRAPTPKHICSELLRVTGAFGLDAAIIGVMPVTGSVRLSRDPRILLDSWPRDWLDDYVQNDYVRRDPVVARARWKPEPFRWSDVRDGSQNFSRGADIFDRAREFGLDDGLVFPMLTPDGSLVMLSLGGPAVEISDTEMSQLSLLATYVLSRAMQFDLSEGLLHRKGRLTPRETECIRWAAAGKSEWEISQILGISEHTSEKHLMNAKVKLGASNRTHAVVEAIKQGYVF